MPAVMRQRAEGTGAAWEGVTIKSIPGGELKGMTQAMECVLFTECGGPTTWLADRPPAPGQSSISKLSRSELDKVWKSSMGNFSSPEQKHLEAKDVGFLVGGPSSFFPFCSVRQ